MRRFAILALIALSTVPAAGPARADIYTWTDANGVVNVSNIAPPPNTRVSNVTVEHAVPPSPPSDGAREAARQAEFMAMADRIRQLENDAQSMPRAALPPPVPPMIAPVYIPMPYPYPMPVPTPAVMPYAEPPPVATCDPLTFGCPYLVPTTVIVTSIVPRRSPYTTKPPGGPVVWPHGNVAALGPWAPGVSPHFSGAPAHPHP